MKWEDNDSLPLCALSPISARRSGSTVWAESCSRSAFGAEGGQSRAVMQQRGHTGNCTPELSVYEGLKGKEQNGPEEAQF